jgi:hypothetical protein
MAIREDRSWSPRQSAKPPRKLTSHETAMRADPEKRVGKTRLLRADFLAMSELVQDLPVRRADESG